MKHVVSWFVFQPYCPGLTNDVLHLISHVDFYFLVKNTEGISNIFGLLPENNNKMFNSLNLNF